MEAGSVSGSFDRLRVALDWPAAKCCSSRSRTWPLRPPLRNSIYISVPFSRQALVLSVLLDRVPLRRDRDRTTREARAIGRPALRLCRSLARPGCGVQRAWLFILFEPLVAPLLYLEFGWAMREVMSSEGRLALVRPVGHRGLRHGRDRLLAHLP